MSETLKARIARRPLLAGGLALLGVVVAGGAAYEAGLFGRGYPRSPYDDLLARLPDRAAAQRLGAAVLAEQPEFNAKAAAAELRQRLTDRPLDDVLVADIDENNMVEVAGWVLPASLAQLSALAAVTA